MAFGISERKIAQMDALEARRLKGDKPPIFHDLEIGHSFFLKDRIFTKIGPVLGKSWAIQNCSGSTITKR
jgi:hypothetical protein